jgi:murein DD-endopeptidase MepM/ murein hydrolase activator NlpD
MDAVKALGPIAGPLPEAPRADQGSAEAAKQFESYLVTFLAQQMRATVKDGPFSSGATAMFADLFDQEIGRRVAEGGGLGLRAQLEQALSVAQDAATPRPEAAHAHEVVPQRIDRNRNAGSRVTSAFGERVDPIDGTRRRHAGVDLAAPIGTPVRSVKDGVVRFAGERGAYGNIVIVDHGDGSESRYAHCDAIDVRPGQQVRAGQDIATVGDTGRSTGPHLHFEFRVRGAAVDPSAFLDTANTPLPR